MSIGQVCEKECRGIIPAEFSQQATEENSRHLLQPENDRQIVSFLKDKGKSPKGRDAALQYQFNIPKL